MEHPGHAAALATQEGVRERLSPVDDVKAAALATRIYDIGWSVRTENATRNVLADSFGCDRQNCTIADLVKRTPADLLRGRNFGRKCLSEVVAWLTERGLSLTPGADGWAGRTVTL